MTQKKLHHQEAHPNLGVRTPVNWSPWIWTLFFLQLCWLEPPLTATVTSFLLFLGSFQNLPCVYSFQICGHMFTPCLLLRSVSLPFLPRAIVSIWKECCFWSTAILRDLAISQYLIKSLWCFKQYPYFSQYLCTSTVPGMEPGDFLSFF